MAESRRSLRAMKASGQLRLTTGRRLISPPNQTTRPTTSRVREAVMNLLAPRLEGSRWLDLCCGSGVIGCEAIERGASAVFAIDRDPRCTKICLQNLQSMTGENNPNIEVRVIRSELLSWLRQGWSATPFDVIYFDPPYESDLYEGVLASLSQKNWINPNGILVCEHRSKATLDLGSSWIVADQRRYGSSSVLLLSRPEHRRGDTDSMQQQTSQEE